MQIKPFNLVGGVVAVIAAILTLVNAPHGYGPLWFGSLCLFFIGMAMFFKKDSSNETD